MTTYAHDAVARSIVAVWTTGAGSAARRVARLPTSTDDACARRLAQTLDTLSTLIWRTYSDPGPDGLRPDTLEKILRRPNLPVSTLLRIADDPLEEAAHAVGRRLDEMGGGPTFVDAVVREVLTDCSAVGAALLGDLTGRAQQAVGLSRWEAPDAQVGRAHILFQEIPMGCERLFTEVEPTAAAVAAVEWLHAAADVTSRLTGHAPADVFALAQAIDGKVLLLAARVLEMFDDGRRPALDVVHDLLSGAFLAGNGVLRAGPRLERAVIIEPGSEPDAEVEAFGDLVDVENLVTTVVSPKDPGRDLLEGLVAGVQGCFEVYLDEITTRERPEPDPRFTGPWWDEEVRQRFDAELRAAVAPAGAA